MNEPLWLSRSIIEEIHAEMIREHGGSYGIRDEGLLESALARPRNKWEYGERDPAVLAAAYAFGLAKNHPFVDGNKRVAFMAAYVFLDVNGCVLQASEPDAVWAMQRLAAGGLTESDFAGWVRENT